MGILFNILLFLHIVVCLLLVLLVIMQRPKQEGLGSAFASGMMSESFGAQATDVLQKATRYLAIFFFILSVSMAGIKSRENRDRYAPVPDEPVLEAPAVVTPAPEADPKLPATDAPDAETAPKPAAETPAPTATPSKPATEAPKPATEAPKPEATPSKPATEAPKPATPSKPAAEAPKPATPPKPASEATPKPAPATVPE